MGKVISFINRKGGVGKTTTAVNIAYTLAKLQRKKVLLIDVDSQMNASHYALHYKQLKSLQERAEEKTLLRIFADHSDLDKDTNHIIHSIANRFDCIPSHSYLDEVNIEKKPLRLREFIEHSGLKQSYDVIIIDCPPSSFATKLALLASDGYLIPCLAEPMSTLGIANLVTDVYNLEKEYMITIELIGILLTMVSPHFHVYQETKELIKQLRINDVAAERYLFQEELRKRTKISHAISQENKQKGNHFLLEIGEPLIFDEIKRIAEEFTRKAMI